MLRADLLELTPEALTALANAGFVKRAQKDLAAGLLPRLQVEPDGCVVAHFDDGTRTRALAGRTLRDAECSCSASSMCRHRVLLVLAYQQAHADAAPAAEASAQADESPWSPAQWDDAALAAAFSPRTLAQAARLAAARAVVGVQPWAGSSAPPTARLPMCSVRFFSRHALAHARCDCVQGSGCEHVVAAVWAFRAAGALAPGAPECMVALTPPPGGAGVAGVADSAPPQAKLLGTEAAQAAVADVQALLLALWLDGSGQPPLALAARFEAVRSRVQALGWAWVDDALAQLWQLLAAQQARSSRFEPQGLLAVVAGLWARLGAAAHAEQGAAGPSAPRLPTSQILGIGVQGAVRLDHLRLVSLGAVLWTEDASAQAMEGASVLLADPDTQTVTVLERQWPRADGASAMDKRRMAGFALHQIASGQIVTRAATRRANGLIDIAAGVRQTSVVPLSPSAWDDLAAPLKHASAATLRRALQDAMPEYVRPREAASAALSGVAGALHVFAPEAGLTVLQPGWDGAAQTLHAQVVDAAHSADDEGDEGDGGEGADAVHLALKHRASAPGAVDTLARALAGEWGTLRAVAGLAHLAGGRIVLQPLALLTSERGVALQVTEPAAQQAAPRLPWHTDGAALAPLHALVHDTLELLALWLRQGLRHQSQASLVRAAEQAQRLRAAGLPRCAVLLQAALAQAHGVGRQHVVERLALLTLMLQGVGES